MLIRIVCTIIDFCLRKVMPFFMLFLLFRWYKKNNGLIISEKDRKEFIDQNKNSSDKGMRDWVELYEDDEKTKKLSRVIFLILFIPIAIMAVAVVYFSIKEYV